MENFEACDVHEVNNYRPSSVLHADNSIILNIAARQAPTGGPDLMDAGRSSQGYWQVRARATGR